MLTTRGQIKKTELTAYKNIRRHGLIAINLDDDDTLGWVKLTDGEQKVLVGSAHGKSILFRESDVRPMSRGTRGVKAMVMKEDDYIVGMAVPQPGQTILTVTTNGYGKRTELATPLADGSYDPKDNGYKIQRRNGSGVINMKLRKDGTVASVLAVDGDEDIMVVTYNGIIIRQKVKDITIYGRGTKGLRIQKLGKSDYIVAIAKVGREEDEPELDIDEDELQSEQVTQGSDLESQE